MGPHAKMPTSQVRAVTVDPLACTGCVLCMKACPVGAIRLRDGVARILEDHCVECGVCFKICPHGAIELRSTPLDSIKAFRYPVATASPTLFSQFGYNVTPNQVLLALKQLGFAWVDDITPDCEMTAVAMEEYLLAHPRVRPGISPQCPVVVRLITKRFPALIRHLAPIMPPRLLAARDLKDRLSRQYGWERDEIGTFIISPCAAKMLASQQTAGGQLDGIICIPEVYGHLLKELGRVREVGKVQRESGMGLAWAVSGGQAEAFSESYTLSVSGFKDVLNILEMVEAGQLSEISFIEAHICRGGCVRGPLTVENPYRAASVIKNLVNRYGKHQRVRRAEVRRRLHNGDFDPGVTIVPQTLPPLDADTGRAIVKMKRIQALAARLPGSECGLCGSPGCLAFARDVVLGRAHESLCPSLEIMPEPQAELAAKRISNMTIREIAQRLDLTVAAGSGGLDKEVAGGYVSDLLSDVMAHASEDALWLTVQNHQNVAAVAVLKDLAAVCLVGGRQPSEELLSKAKEESLPILLASQDAFTLAGLLHGLGLGGGA